MRRSPMLIGLVAAGILVAGCGKSGSAGSAPSAADLQQDFAKVLSTRATALDDLQTVQAAVTAVQRADDEAATGKAGTAGDLITEAARESALAAPIVARTRSDVVSYQNALDGLEQHARNPETPLEDPQRATIAALCATGRSEAEAIRATAAAFAAEWQSYAGLAAALQTWLQHSEKGQYPTTDDAKSGYGELTDQYDSDLAIGRTSVDAAESGRNAATVAMGNGIDALRASVLVLAAVPSPSPKESSSPSASGRATTRAS